MGLFDGYQFDPQSYGGDVQGLLARLLPQLQQMGQSQGFPGQPSPMNAQAAAPAAPAPENEGTVPRGGKDVPDGSDAYYTMPIGNYQMPVMSPYLGAPDQGGAALPPNSAPTQGQMPQQQMPPQQPPSPGVGDRLGSGMSGFMENAHTGPIGALLGGLSGLVTGKSAHGELQKQQNQTVQALVSKGVDPQIAQAAVGNPELMKQLITQTFAKPTIQNLGSGYIARGDKVEKAYEPEENSKWSIVGKDKYGQPVYGYPPTREQAAAAAAATPAASQDQSGDLTNVHGKEYIAQLKQSDPGLASQVQAIIEGRAAYPTGMLLKTPYGQALAQHVTQADPSFEAGNATARVKTRNEFYAGGVSSPAGQITAGNTALQHAGEMSDALEKMKADKGVLAGVGGAGIPYLSYYASQMHNSAVQGTPEGKAYAEFMTAKNHFSEEVTKFYAGSAGSEAERARALANLDAAKSLPELRSAIQKEADLMQGKVNALQDRWRNGMGPLVEDFPLIQPKSQDAMDRIRKREQTDEAPAPAAPAQESSAPVKEGAMAVNPKTGERLMLKNGKWMPFA